MKTPSSKKYFLILVTFKIIFFSSLFGQKNEENRNHIGINLFAIRFVSENYTSTGYKDCFLNGIYFKHDTKNFTVRYFLNFNEFKSNYHDGPITGNDIMYESNQYSLWTIGSGIQKNINFNKLCLFFGFDLLSDFSINKEHVIGGIAGFNNYYKYYHLWLGIRPLVGLQYQFTKRISLSIESNYNLAYRIRNTDKYINSVKSFQTYFNPINTILLSYDF